MRDTSKYSEFACMGRLNHCSCGANKWVYLRDSDHGDWCEEVFECDECKKVIYVELPD